MPRGCRIPRKCRRGSVEDFPRPAFRRADVNASLTSADAGLYIRRMQCRSTLHTYLPGALMRVRPPTPSSMYIHTYRFTLMSERPVSSKLYSLCMHVVLFVSPWSHRRARSGQPVLPMELGALNQSVHNKQRVHSNGVPAAAELQAASLHR